MSSVRVNVPDRWLSAREKVSPGVRKVLEVMEDKNEGGTVPVRLFLERSNNGGLMVARSLGPRSNWEGRGPLILLFDKFHWMDVDETFEAIEDDMVPVILVLVSVRDMRLAGALWKREVFRKVLVMVREYSDGYWMNMSSRFVGQSSPVDVVTKELSTMRPRSPPPNRINGLMSRLDDATILIL